MNPEDADGLIERDRQIMRRQAAALRDIETDEPGDREQRDDAIDAANADRGSRCQQIPA